MLENDEIADIAIYAQLNYSKHDGNFSITTSNDHKFEEKCTRNRGKWYTVPGPTSIRGWVVGGVPHFYPHFLGVGFFHTKPLFWGVGGWGKPPKDTPPPNRPLPV